jgi:hypothetical protein
METFDDLVVQRGELARSYLQLLNAQPGRPLALFAPRRVGKTHFIQRDLAPAAQASGMLPVYADLWLHRREPLAAINHAVEEVLDDVLVPKSAVARAAKTPVRKLGVLSASIELGDEPQRRKLPEHAELRLDALIGRLASASRKPVLLLLDEVQTLGDSYQGKDGVATLRAILQRRHKEVRAVFTGSSQESLAAMMVAAGAPMYQFAQLLDFPLLGDEYLVLLAEHFRKVHRSKRLAIDALREVFDRIGHKPELMKDIVKEMSAEGIVDIHAGLDRFTRDNRQITGWRTLFEGLSSLEQAVLTLIAAGEPPLGQESLAKLANVKGIHPTLAKVRVALAHMKQAGILAKGGSGAYVIDDPLFSEYVKKIRVTDLR